MNNQTIIEAKITLQKKGNCIEIFNIIPKYLNHFINWTNLN